MDDILRIIKSNLIDDKLVEINNLHPNLKFIVECESECSLPFLHMKIIRKNNSLSSVWYTKPTGTGLMMNFHELAPIRYKRLSLVWYIA